MTAIPRYVSSSTEAAARIAGYIVGAGNPDVQYNPLGGLCFTFIGSGTGQQAECVRCAGVIGWTEGTQWAHANNGNFKVRRDALYAALGITDSAHNLYYRLLNPTGTYTPTRVQVEAFSASIIETQGALSTNPPKWFEDGRGGVYDQRVDAMVLTMLTQIPSAFRSGNAAKATVADTDSFPMPLIDASRYPGFTPADWPDGPPPPPDLTAPSIPTGLAVLPGNTQCIITWNIPADSDLAGYILYRGDTEVYVGAVPSFIDSGRTNGVEVCYEVAAFDLSENASALSAPVCATPTGGVDPGDTVPPDPPSGLMGSTGGTTATLTWSGSVATDVASYRVYRGSTLVATVTAPTTLYTDTGLTPDSIYAYRVSAVDVAGNESTSTPFLSLTTADVPVDPPLITQTPIVLIDRLGCGETQAFIAHRSGWPLLTELPATSGSWNRVTDEISDAKVQMEQANLPAECATILQGITRWAYELVIFRDGVRVWTGPVQDVLPEGENLSITARDKMAWTTVRPIWTYLNYPDPGEEMATVFNDVIANAMLPDNVPGLVGTATATGLRAVREYKPNPPQYAWDALNELARTGVDFTMIGPTMVAGSFIVPASPIAFLTEQAFSELPSTPLLAANVGTQWMVTGDPEQNLFASHGGIDSLVGLVVRIAQEDDIKDQASLDQNAKSRWELTASPLIAEYTITLSQEAPWPVEIMTPGCTVDIRFSETLFPIVGHFRLKRVEFDWSSGGDGPAETCRITVEPVGTELIS